MESRERMEQMMEEQYNKGITVGMELMMEKVANGSRKRYTD